MITIYYYAQNTAAVINPLLAESQQMQSEDLTQYRDENWSASRVNVSALRLNEISARDASQQYSNLISLQIQEDESSYRSRGLMQRPQLVLKFSLPTYVDIPVGAWCTYQGERFVLPSSKNLKKQATRNIEYTMTMGTYQDNLAMYKMRNSVDGRLKYSMCSTPTEFIQEIVANLNARDGANVWHVGDCIDVPPKTVEFNHTYIDSALSSVAEAFETEWEIKNYYIHLRPVKYFESTPLALSYGKGNGFQPGVGRTTPTNEQPIKRLYVQGGSQNIDRSQYGSADLLLPISQTLQYDGEHFEGDTGFDLTKARTYRSSADGLYIERYDAVTDSSKEDSIDCDEIYPSRVGYVTQVVQTTEGSNVYYDIVDNTIPLDLDYWDDDVRIAGETMTIIFQTGMLAGKEFDIQRYEHSERKFLIVPQEIDGQTMPNSTFAPAVGDTYAIFNCMLPDAYICDNSTKTGASWDMFREAVRYLYEHEVLRFTFSGVLQGLWAKRNWANISDKLVVGGYIHFSDEQFAPDGTDIRIIGIKDYLVSPYEPTLDISNTVMGQSITTVINQVQSQEVVIGEAYDSAISFTKRRFRDAKETMQMLENSLLNFSNSINPVAVQTMQLLIGDESLQFRFVNPSTQQVVNYQVQYNTTTKRLSCPAGFLQHMTIELPSLSVYSWNDYKIWEMTAFTSSVLSDATKSYYLYAKCLKTATRSNDPNNPTPSTDNVFVLSETAIGMESVTGYYHFLVGILNSEIDGERSYVDLYGFSEILPGRITTDKIISSDGDNWFDLVNGHIQANSAYIRGTFRSPFMINDYYQTPPSYDKYDNIICDAPVTLPWDATQSGRRMTIAGDGVFTNAPSGKYYFVNGERLTTFGFSNEIVQCIGLGTESSFDGWLIQRMGALRYQDGNTIMKSSGSPLHAVMMAQVCKNSSNQWALVPSHPINHHSYTATMTRTGVGAFNVALPRQLFGLAQSVSDYLLHNYIAVFATAAGADAQAVVSSVKYIASSDNVVIEFSIQRSFGEYYEWSEWDDVQEDYVTYRTVRAKALDAPFCFAVIDLNRWQGWSNLS